MKPRGQPKPLFPIADRLGIRWVSYDRPGYGGSTPHPDRDVASAAAYVSVVADALGVEAGPGGLIDDDLAYVAPWGFEPAQVTAPTLLLHGGRDRVVPAADSEWLARGCPSAELWLRPDDGHITILNQGPAAMGWLREHADRG